MIPYFFFQAEDGIRDLYVTGVQTCALPIYRRARGVAGGGAAAGGRQRLRARRRAAGARDPSRGARGRRAAPARARARRAAREDRKSVVEGKSTDRGGRRLTRRTKHNARPPT